MRYLQTQIYTTDTGIEELTGLLMRFNIDQTVVESPETAHEILDKKHDYEWDYVDEDFIDDNAEPKITFYLSDDEDGRRLLKSYHSYGKRRWRRSFRTPGNRNDSGR